MNNWVLGEKRHTPLLQSFQCANPQANEPWAEDVQGLIRNQRPHRLHREKPPAYLYLREDLAANIAEAAALIQPHWHDDGNHIVDLHALAVHLERQRQGLGREGLHHAVNQAIDLAQERPRALSLAVLAHVHTENLPCQSLMRAEGYEQAGPHAKWPDYQVWHRTY